MKKSKRRKIEAAPAPVAPALDWRDVAAAVWAVGILTVFLRQLLAALVS